MRAARRRHIRLTRSQREFHNEGDNHRRLSGRREGGKRERLPPVIVAFALLVLCGVPAFADVGPCLNEPFVPESKIQGSPFWNCGEEAGAQTPSPTASPHAFQIDGYVLCVSPDFTPQRWMFKGTFPDIVVEASDVVILNGAALPGTVHLLGERIQWWNVPGGSMKSPPIIGWSANDVEVEGECLRGEAVPEPTVGLGVIVGMMALFVARRGALRKASVDASEV